MEIYVDEFALTPKRFIAGTKGSYGFCTMCFRFGAEWDGLAKKVTFYPLDGSDPVYLIVSDDKVEIPQEIMRCAGVNRYVVSGCKNEDVLISITGEIDVLDSLSPDGVSAEEPTPTQMEQVMTMMQRAVDVAQSVRDDADNGVFDGEKGDTGEKGERGEKGDKGDTGEVTLDCANNTFANALRGTASGEAVAITDVSPLEHRITVKVRGKNLVNLSNSYVTSGGEMTIDGTTIALTRKATGNPPSIIWELGAYKDFVGKTLTISFVLDAMGSSGGTNGTATMYIHCGNTTKEAVESVNTVSYTSEKVGTTITKTFTVPVLDDKGRQLCIRHYMSNGKTEGDYITISNVQVEESSTATTYAPYVEDISTVQVGTCGKNVFFTTTERKEYKGITAEKTEDGTFHVYGTSDGTGDFWMDMNMDLPRGIYTGSGCPKGGSSTTWFVEYHNKNTGKGKIDYGDGVEFDTSATQTIAVHLVVRNGQTVDLVFKPMIELGTGDKVYEPFKIPAFYIPDSNGETSVKSVFPVTTLLSNTDGVIIDCTYNRDVNKAYAELYNAIISTGGNV